MKKKCCVSDFLSCIFAYIAQCLSRYLSMDIFTFYNPQNKLNKLEKLKESGTHFKKKKKKSFYSVKISNFIVMGNHIIFKQNYMIKLLTFFLNLKFKIYLKSGVILNYCNLKCFL